MARFEKRRVERTVVSAREDGAISNRRAAAISKRMTSLGSLELLPSMPYRTAGNDKAPNMNGR
jgi:hypothetical protein